MVREVGNIGWFSFEEALAHLRITNVEKRAVLVKLNTDITTTAGKEKVLNALDWVSVKYSP
jgi:hypothetical protein